jgi:hypothetical protein
MNSLIINPSYSSPKVIMDPENNFFLLEGDSFPESAEVFYKPILDWLNEYKYSLFLEKRRITFQLELNYYNCSSAKYIRNILLLFDSISKEGHEITINWLYEEGDVDMKTSVEDYVTLLKHLPINVVSAGYFKNQPVKNLKCEYLYN